MPHFSSPVSVKDPLAVDAKLLTRLLHRLEPDPGALWAEAAPQVDRAAGLLVLDDSTLDKPYAKAIELVKGVHDDQVDGSTSAHHRLTGTF